MLALSLFTACEKDSIISEISGTFYSDCEQPYDNAEIGLKSSGLSGNSEPLILGSAITNKDGSFSFTYELEDNEGGNADLILFNKVGYETIIKNIPLKRNLDLQLYLNNEATIVLNLLANQPLLPNDTLFYGITKLNVDTFKLQPQTGVLDTIVKEVPNTFDGGMSATIYYGVGTADFLKSKEAVELQDSVFQNISLNLEGCLKVEQDTLQIN